jgi:RNA polymerase sigma factor (sigma-70 family)
MTVGPAFDSVLVAAQAGTGWARTRLYQSLAPAVAGYVRAQGVSDPADVTSDVFVSVLSGLGSFAGDERQFRSWVFTIAYRRVSDHWRSRARSNRVTLVEPADLAFHWSDATAAAEDTALGRIEGQHLQRLLDELTDDQRNVLALRVIADLSIEEVARILGKPAGAIKALQHRALATLRRRISAEAVSPERPPR